MRTSSFAGGPKDALQCYFDLIRNVPIYIHPHIKGPEDKPLKVPSPTVFAVTR